MSVYVDANILVSMFVSDALSSRMRTTIARLAATLVVSDLAAVEFASALSRRVRAGDLTRPDAQAAFGHFDAWSSAKAETALATSQDFAVCSGYLRRLDLPLRTPDALHIAIASRLGAPLLSFDKQLVACAGKLGVAVARP